VGLNFAEGVHAPGGHRRSRLSTAIGSAREVTFALRIAAACGYLAPKAAAAELDELDRITAVLWKLTYRKAS
jgi:four helix bundle protein